MVRRVRWLCQPDLFVPLGLMICLNLTSMMMEFSDCSILSWNIRGVISSLGKRHIRSLVMRYNPSFVILLKTHAAFDRVASFWSSLGYHAIYIVDAVGHSGGIFVLGQVHGFAACILHSFSQAVTIRISSGSRHWACTAVYASPIPSLRADLWSHLRDIRSAISIPWVLLGDFNEVLLSSEVSLSSAHWLSQKSFKTVIFLTLDQRGTASLGSVDHRVAMGYLRN